MRIAGRAFRSGEDGDTHGGRKTSPFHCRGRVSEEGGWLLVSSLCCLLGV